VHIRCVSQATDTTVNWENNRTTIRPSANKVLRVAHEDGILRLSRGSIEILDLALLTKRTR
jgi:hypothetical protein